MDIISSSFPVYTASGGRLSSTMTMATSAMNSRSRNGAGLLAWEIERHAALSAGIRYKSGDVDLDIGDPAQQDFSFDNAAYVLQFEYDRVDDSYFPSTGTTFQVKYLDYNEDLGSDEGYEQIVSTDHRLGNVFQRGRIGR
jgi:outer membrane translocation and assembly module TamA